MNDKGFPVVDDKDVPVLVTDNSKEDFEDLLKKNGIEAKAKPFTFYAARIVVIDNSNPQNPKLLTYKSEKLKEDTIVWYDINEVYSYLDKHKLDRDKYPVVPL